MGVPGLVLQGSLGECPEEQVFSFGIQQAGHAFSEAVKELGQGLGMGSAHVDVAIEPVPGVVAFSGAGERHFAHQDTGALPKGLQGGVRGRGLRHRDIRAGLDPASNVLHGVYQLRGGGGVHGLSLDGVST